MRDGTFGFDIAGVSRRASFSHTFRVTFNSSCRRSGGFNSLAIRIAITWCIFLLLQSFEIHLHDEFSLASSFKNIPRIRVKNIYLETVKTKFLLETQCRRFPILPNGPIDPSLRTRWERLRAQENHREAFALQWITTHAALRDARESLERRRVTHRMCPLKSYVRCLRFNDECIVAGLYDGCCQVTYFVSNESRTLPLRCTTRLHPLTQTNQQANRTRPAPPPLHPIPMVSSCGF
jgi:hypothetical protein